MKYLIVNAVDFGASRGINCGIFQAHHEGIVTSATLLVSRPNSLEAVEMSRAMPRLSVGLQADLEQELAANVSAEHLRAALETQLEQFYRLLDRGPTHLDADLHLVRARRAMATLLEFSKEKGLPLREHSMVRHLSSFHGRWNGMTSFQRVSAENLAFIIKNEIRVGITELGCHPGYVDARYSNPYHAEREAELHALCDPLVRKALEAQSIRLISYHDLARFQNKSPRINPASRTTISRA
jgi:predicted glycoside hydrolase/deacetylase ChbG (UPF0249 family)